ncbi:MAG TPA: serine hydrolase domain-containing protein [Gemmatimonadales bacterium]|nr:serine hydrolase domain-containing protein [Gemmatimonadales bacterium]
MPPRPAPPRVLAALPLVALALGCGQTDPPSAPTDPPEAPPGISAAITTGGFSWTTATPESQGMCGTTKRLGCTKTLQNIWNSISNPIHNTKRFLVIRNDRIIYDRGGTLAYPVYSASKGLLGAPTLVHAMSSCGVGLNDRASHWLAHDDGARWATDWPWTDITVEHLATHTSGVCDYGNSSTVCRNQNGNWQTIYNAADRGGTTYVYPRDAFTIARTRAEQNREPALAPGSVVEYSNVGHGLMNYVVQRACGQKLTDIYDLFIKQPGMGSPVGAALIYTDDNQQFNQSTGVARWKGVDGAAVLRLAARQGIWGNKNVEPARYWALVTQPTKVAAAAAAGRGVVFENNSQNLFTQSTNHRKLSLETFFHGGNYSTLFLIDPLTSTTIVRQGENNATGASYLTTNGCAPGWTGTAPTCTAGTNWTNNWGVANGTVGSSQVGVRKKVVEPLQEAFFFPPPFCRMTSVAGQPVDHTTDVYQTGAEAAPLDLTAEITVNPREGAGSSEIDKVLFYKEVEGTAPALIGEGTLVPGTSPARYQLSYSAESHGAAGETRTYFANCVARSTKDRTKKVPSYSRPVRVIRSAGG